MAGGARIPQTVQAIVLDTNSGARGMLDLGSLQQLIDVLDDQELDTEIWIPEPTLWEWAQHAHELIADISSVVRKHEKSLQRSGIESFVDLDDEFTLEEIVELLEDKLADLYRESGAEAIRVLRLVDFPAAAAEGLRDQVLLRGAGRRKNGIKTGAADSTSWRLLADAAGRYRLSDVVLVTRDEDAQRHFAATSDPILLPGIWDVKQQLQQLENGSRAAAEAVRRAVSLTLPRLDEVALARAEIDGRPRLDDTPGDAAQPILASNPCCQGHQRHRGSRCGRLAWGPYRYGSGRG